MDGEKSSLSLKAQVEYYARKHYSEPVSVLKYEFVIFSVYLLSMQQPTKILWAGLFSH